MPKRKKKTMAVHEMAELLGLKKTPHILKEDAQSVPEDFDVARYTREYEICILSEIIHLYSF